MEGFFAHGTRGHIWIDNIHMSSSTTLTECTRKSRCSSNGECLSTFTHVLSNLEVGKDHASIDTDFYFFFSFWYSNHVLRTCVAPFFLGLLTRSCNSACFNKWSQFFKWTFPLNWMTFSDLGLIKVQFILLTLSLVKVVFQHCILNFRHAWHQLSLFICLSSHHLIISSLSTTLCQSLYFSATSSTLALSSEKW